MYSQYSVNAAVCSVVFPALASLAVALRLRARKIKSLRYAADDYIIISCLCVVIGCGCLELYGSIRGGIGQRQEAMTVAEYIDYRKRLYAEILLNHLGMGLVKLSALSFYKRIFAIKNFRRVANIVIASVWAWILAGSLAHIFSYWPISDFFSPTGKSNFNYVVFIVVFAATDVALDVITLSLPLFVITSLQMSSRRKITLAGIFSLGFFCVVAGSVRVYFSSLALNPKRPRSDEEPPYGDYYSYVAVNLTIWSLIEPCASIIAVCLPTYAPLVRGGLSLRSLARSLQSRLLKRSGSASTDSEQLAGARPPLDKATWVELTEEGRSTPRIGGVELGKPESHSTRLAALEGVDRPKTPWNPPNESTSSWHIGHAEVRPKPKNEGIQVKTTFLSQTERKH